LIFLESRSVIDVLSVAPDVCAAAPALRGGTGLHAFSGSHQDAIKKGLAEWEGKGRDQWDVPYLTLTRRTSDAIPRSHPRQFAVRQRRRAYLLESDSAFCCRKTYQREFGPICERRGGQTRRESAAGNQGMFWKEYIERNSPWQLLGFETEARMRRQMLRETLTRRKGR